MSAYFYCKKGAVDGLCGKAAVRAQEVDLVTFARHWGNFGLRQFLYGDVTVAAIAASKADEPEGRDGKRYPAWWEMKRYIERLAVNRSVDPAAAARSSENMTSIEYPVLKTFLAQVKDRLNDRYAAVGILEDWPTTMRLFNAAIRLPNYDWENAPHIGEKNSNSVFRKEAEDALRSARSDPDIHEFIRLDILLYQHALEVHAKQVREYGVGDK